MTILVILTTSAVGACLGLLYAARRERNKLDRQWREYVAIDNQRIERHFTIARAAQEEDPALDANLLADWLADNGEAAAADKIRAAFPLRSDSDRAIARRETEE